MNAERLANRAAALESERVPYVQATVVRAARPASVQAGAVATRRTLTMAPVEHEGHGCHD